MQSIGIIKVIKISLIYEVRFVKIMSAISSE